MSTQVKVAGFAASLAAAFAIAFGIGSAVGPLGDDQPATETGTTQTTEPAPHESDME